MGKTVTTRYDVAEHLRTPQEMAAYLEACLEEADGDAAFVAKALGDIARAKGMTQVARDAGLSRESLYKALSGERTPGFDTILKVVAALGLKLHAEAATAAESALVDLVVFVVLPAGILIFQGGLFLSPLTQGAQVYSRCV